MKTFFSFTVLLFIIIATLFGSSCANIIPPGGGPRDTIPPRLLSAEPHDSTLNFRSDKVVFTFDEYVDLQDVQNNLLFTPLFQNNPKVEAKGKTITVRFQDKLDSNTTYILNFGNSIKDFNEGAVLKNFVYTFSTGPALDSLELKGRVVLAQTGKVDSNLVVVLHRNLKDSAVLKQRPQYVVKLDSAGNFYFHHLPAETFAIYALGDGGTSRRYQNKTQLFAFADSPVTAGARDSAILLYAYRETERSLPSVSNPMARPGGNRENRLIFTTNLNNNQQDLLNDLILTFTTPLRTFDSTKLILSTDSTFNKVSYSPLLDSTRKELRLKTAWRENTRYNLVLDRDFAADTLGRKLLKSDTLFFTTRKEADYGNLVLNFKNVDTSKNPILQIVQNDKVILSASITSGTFSQSRFVPGDYELRVLYDTNNNGKWDPGNFFVGRKQPEIVQTLGQKITVKPNWENKFELAL